VQKKEKLPVSTSSRFTSPIYITDIHIDRYISVVYIHEMTHLIVMQYASKL